MLTREQVQNTLIERLFWHTSERDESKVAQHLFCHKEMDTVYTLDEATLFDFSFHYLREIDVPVHKTAKELGVTRTSIYSKYTGLSPP